MIFFIFIFLISDFSSFLIILTNNLDLAIYFKKVSLFLVVIVSLTSLLKKKTDKLELLYLVYSFLVISLSLLFNNFTKIITLQSGYLLIYPLLFTRLGSKYNDNVSIIKFEKFIIFFSLSNFIFMVFEINNTSFLVNMGLSDYFKYVKGVLSGINIKTGLPFNWHTDFDANTRRGAGLLLAPLASAMLHAFASYICILRYVDSKSNFFLIAVFLNLYALYLTNSRGPMLFLLISIIIYFYRNKKEITKKLNIKLCLTFFLIFFIYLILPTLISAVNLEDSRSMAHFISIINNLKGLNEIPFFGYGVGTLGSQAVQNLFIDPIKGYGAESSLFSSIYQAGILFGLVFLIWHFRLLKFVGKKAYPLLFSGIPIMLTSEHYFTITGYIYIWYYIGLNIKKNENITSI